MADHAHAAAHAAHDEHHPDFSTYWKIAVILMVITIVEVAAYYIPSFVASAAYSDAGFLPACVPM